MIWLDTSSLIRFFTNDEPKKALKVKALLKKEREIHIPEVVFPELEYVLFGNYKLRRKKIISIFKFLISQKNVKVNKIVKKAVEIFETTNLDMADCLIATHSLKGKLASFDKQLLSVKKIRGYWLEKMSSK